MPTITAQRIPVTLPQGGECEPCVKRLSEAMASIPGLQSAEYDPRTSTLVVTFDPDKQSIDEIRRRAHEAGAELAQKFSHATFTLTDLDCADCARKVERGVSHVPGVTRASVNFAASKLGVEYETGKTTNQDIIKMVETLGYGAIPEAVVLNVTQSTFRLTGMDCADCAKKLEKVVGSMDGVTKAEVNFTAATMTVVHDCKLAPTNSIIKAIEAAGYGAELKSAEKTPATRRRVLD